MGENTIYTRDEAALIIELFESVLDKYNIKIPSPEDDERESDNETKPYGSTYQILSSASLTLACSAGLQSFRHRLSLTPPDLYRVQGDDDRKLCAQ